MPDMIRAAIAKYKNIDPDWKEATERYRRGELIPNNLALELVQAEMRKHQEAKAFFLEGFPREARQVESFEREVRPVNMALILDYDEGTLRRHMESRGLDTEIIDAKIREFKLKTLPSAKYFDDQRLLHLIPGEQTDQWIFERMKMLIQRAMELGIPITTSKVASRIGSPLQRPDTVPKKNLNLHTKWCNFRGIWKFIECKFKKKKSFCLRILHPEFEKNFKGIQYY
ncbi:unnamed protein product [Onchocerca flexuosa]|uniref:Adenylate kinase n=1 Tax=Onchocerca flexuosa TaxID=387005 RepID=A0A183HGD8_9BILA|nr:unnamed protein product [Onchocerca flexuosa]